MIAPEGWPFILVPLCVGAAAWFFGWPVIGGILIALGVFGMFFFRNPDRRCNGDPLTACSPADGKVIMIGSAPDELVHSGLPQQVSVFMSVFDVHVNRAAIGGTLVDYSYNPGRKVAAFKEKASLENEQNLSVWRVGGSPHRVRLFPG